MKKNYLPFWRLFCILIITATLFTGSTFAQLTVQNFSYTGTIQNFTVPNLCVSTITIEARGAQGGDNVTLIDQGGKGAQMIGTFTASPGQVLKVIVGQRGLNNTGGNAANGAGGGGGGSFVYLTGASVPMIVAGGGGASCLTNNGAPNYYGKDASITTTATGSRSHDVFSNSPGGVNGADGTSVCGSGGKGWINVLINPAGNPAGNATYGAAGGYGGGGGGGTTPNGSNNTLHTGGGGGGYSGGGAGGTNYYHGGGGGGSFNAGTNQVNTATVQSGHGLVVISYVSGSGVVAASSSSLICNGGSATLTASGVPTYSWYNGATTPTIVVSPSVTTTYSVVGTSSALCNSTVFVTVNVNQAVPSLSVANTTSASGGICPSSTAALTASGANTYTWTGNVLNGAQFSPTISNTYVVTGENGCGTSTAAVSISVHPLPTVSGIASTPTICSGNPVSLTGVGNAVTYTWTGGILNGINFFPGTTGSYTVTGTSALSCTNTAVSTITVVTTPVAQPFATPPLICIGSSSSLTAAGATTYTWITPTGVFNTTGINVTPTVTTTYTVTKANANCANTQTVNVIVNMLPNIFAIVTPTLICANNPATLTAAGAATYTWAAAGPPVFTVTGANPVVSPGVSTMYTITASDGTCVNTGAVFLAVNPNPTLSIVPSSSVICRGQSATLTASGALSYTWTTPTTTIANVSIVESPTNSVLYTVVGTNTFNCTSPVSQVVVVNPTPTLQVYSNKPLVCIGAPASLTVSGANTYQWDANANNATTPVTQVNPNSTTIYSVTGFITATGCNSTKTIQINVFSPTFAVNNPTSSCLGGTINLIATGAISYTWNGNQPFQMISVSPPTATVYVVSATSQSNGVSCISSNSVGVSIYANPTITAVSQRTLICKGEYGNLVASGAQTYEWSTSQTGSVVPVNPTAAQNIYTVTGTDQNGCVGTATVMQKVSTCFGINEQSAAQLGLSIFPNPNNGTFTIKSTVDLTLSLVNELGQLVVTINLSSHNNHQQQIRDLANGIYFINGQQSSYQLKEKIVVDK